jgi:hypothetical protein
MPLIMFPLVVHTLDLVVSAAGIMSVRSTAAPGSNRVEDPYAVMKQGYAVCISLAVVGFGLATRLMLEVRPTPLHRLYPVCVHPLHHAAGQGARWALRTPQMHLCPLSTVSSAWDLASRMRRHQCACTPVAAEMRLLARCTVGSSYSADAPLSAEYGELCVGPCLTHAPPPVCVHPSRS